MKHKKQVWWEIFPGPKKFQGFVVALLTKFFINVHRYVHTCVCACSILFLFLFLFLFDRCSVFLNIFPVSYKSFYLGVCKYSQRHMKSVVQSETNECTKDHVVIQDPRRWLVKLRSTACKYGVMDELFQDATRVLNAGGWGGGGGGLSKRGNATHVPTRNSHLPTPTCNVLFWREGSRSCTVQTKRETVWRTSRETCTPLNTPRKGVCVYVWDYMVYMSVNRWSLTADPSTVGGTLGEGGVGVAHICDTRSGPLRHSTRGSGRINRRSGDHGTSQQRRKDFLHPILHLGPLDTCRRYPIRRRRGGGSSRLRPGSLFRKAGANRQETIKESRSPMGNLKRNVEILTRL